MTLFTHYFECEECETVFSVMTTNAYYSCVLGTIDCMVSCPNSMCKSVNVIMNDVTEEERI